MMKDRYDLAAWVTGIIVFTFTAMILFGSMGGRDHSEILSVHMKRFDPGTGGRGI